MIYCLFITPSTVSITVLNRFLKQQWLLPSDWISFTFHREAMHGESLLVFLRVLPWPSLSRILSF